MEDSGNSRPWKEPGTAAAKYCLFGGREAKRVLKSFDVRSLKYTKNSGISESRLRDWYFCLIESSMFWTAMNVLGPVEHPKSTTENAFDVKESFVKSSSLEIASSIMSLEASMPAL